MARHIMAVCVVCLLCADHLPCEQHLELLLKSRKTLNDDNVAQKSAEVFKNTNLLQYPFVSVVVGNTNIEINHDNHREVQKSSKIQRNDKKENHRVKRHADHYSRTDSYNTLKKRPEITEEYLEKIFIEYGQKDGTIQRIEFERMLTRLGLAEFIGNDTSSDSNDTVNLLFK